jgi:RimJ/RimL family protein N-acetyltransferase
MPNPMLSVSMPYLGATLVGKWVQLEPLVEEHREPLRIAANDERIWRHMLVNAAGAGFDEWFDRVLVNYRNGVQIPFVVRLLADRRVVGSTSYLDTVEQHKRIEIGSTWYTPDVWETAVNPECKYLLLRHAFGVFGVNRVALITDLRNERSQAAIAKLGAVREGVLRGHMITQGDRARDSVVFSIVVAEWPTVEARLRTRLAGLSA